MATSVTQEVIEPDYLRRSSSVGKSSHPNIGHSKFFDYPRSSRGKPTAPNNGLNILPHRTRASTGSLCEMVSIPRHSTGKASSPKSRESISPHYLRASTGSCHDFCKYGRKHEFEVKSRRPIPKRSIKLSSEEQNPTEFVVSAERKIPAKVKPKPYPASKALSIDSSCSIKQNPTEFVVSAERKIPLSIDASCSIKQNPTEFVVSVEKKIPLSVDSSCSIKQNPTKFAVSAERKIPAMVKVKVRSKPYPVSKALSVDSSCSIKQDVAPPSNKVKIPLKKGSANEKERAHEKNTLSGKKAPVKPKSTMVKPSTFPDTSGSLNGRKNSEIKVAKKTETSIAAVKKIVATPKASLTPKPSNNGAVILNVKRHRSTKLLSPLKDQNRVRKTEAKQPHSEKVPEKTLRVIKVETENEVLECAQNGITIHSPLSPKLSMPKSSLLQKSPALSSQEEEDQVESSLLQKSPALSSQEEEDQVESEYTESEEVDQTDYSVADSSETVKLHKVETLEGNGKRTPGKGRLGISDDKDCSPAKLKFRRGKMVDLKPENGGPRRLRFRRGRVLGEDQDTKSDIRKVSFKNRGVEGDTNGTLPGSRGNQKRTPVKGKVGISEDCEQSKLKFRGGKVVDPQLENGSPRRLRFRRGLALAKNQDSKSDVGKTGFKERGVEGDANGTELSSEKVVLRHQDVQQGKKDAQGLFNNVIEETANKLVESRKSKVKALVGAFETVISLQETKPST